jgi:hypothetical protein
MYPSNIIGWFGADERALYPRSPYDEGRVELERFALITPWVDQRRAEVAAAEPIAAFGPRGRIPAAVAAKEALVIERPIPAGSRLAFMVGVMAIAALAVVFG